MTELAEFFDRFDAMKPTRPMSAALTDAGMAEASESVLPLYQQLADRAGVDLDALFAEQRERWQQVPGLVVARCLTTGRPLQVELLAAFANIAAESFMAGVLWQQERELPQLEEPT